MKLRRMKLLINGETWTVKFERPTKREIGKCYYSRKLIKVDPIEGSNSTLIHEILHAAFPSATEPRILEAEAAISTAMQTLWKC